VKVYTKPIEYPVCAECGSTLSPANPFYHPDKPAVIIWKHGEDACKNHGLSIALPHSQIPIEVEEVPLPKGTK